MKRIILLTMLMAFCFAYSAQAELIKGQITSIDDGTPLSGVTIKVKGTQLGAISKTDGTWQLDVPDKNAILVFSSIGFETLEEPIKGRSNVNVSLLPSSVLTDEVVVTAFGMKRDKKALGYSVQEIQGDNVSETKGTNIVNQLNGRVAGVQVMSGNSGEGSTARITIRGENSLTGDNQPLFIVDGVPIANSSDLRSNVSGSVADNMEIDYGNYASDINPDDIESISVLKGPNATALYGSRAANGVVLITTKSGKQKKGFGVSFNSTATWETLLAYPEFQDVYGQGKNGQFSWEDGYGSGDYDGVDESWGPKMDGQMIKQFDSPTSTGLRGGDVHGLSFILGSKGVDLDRRGTVEATPWVHHGDPVESFFEVGHTFTNNLAFYGSNENGNFRLSLTNMDNKGITPNTAIQRNNISLKAGYKFFDDLEVNASANYINTDSPNRHNNSYGTESIMYLFTWWGQQINMESLKDYWQEGLEGFQQFNYNYNYHDNPYFNMFENTNGMLRDRLIGNVSLKYNILDNFTFTARTGIDYFHELRTIKRAYSTQRFPNGQYREDKITFSEMNSDFMFTYWDDFSSGNFEYRISVGGNKMYQKNHFNLVTANKLVIPGVYSFTNTDIPLVTVLNRSAKEINSIYSFAQLSWKNMIYLDLTGRNDWSSTLPEDNNSYFYPSASLSFIVSDLIGLPQTSPVTFAKVRLGWAQVGNDTDPYRLQNVYSFSNPWDDNLIANESSSIANTELKPEIATSFEIGADLRFIDNRIGLDFTYYTSTTENQILGVQIPISSGYSQRLINAGKISSNGIEAMLNVNPISLENGFRWDLSLNFAKNYSEVVELAEGLETYTISGNRVTILAKEGEEMGSMWGTGFLEEDGKIIFRNGLPVQDNELRLLGNYNPDWILGIYNRFQYRNWTLEFLFDWRQGGDLMSLTRLIAATAGNIVETLWGRDPEHGGAHPGIKDSGLEWTDSDGNVRYDGIIGDGLKEVYDGDGNVIGYEENDVIVAASSYHNKRYKRQNETEGMYDASFVKLRELSIGYEIPRDWAQKFYLESLKISLVGRNLLLWTDFNHGDPETLSFSTGTQMIPGVEDMALPSTRSWGFNINLKF